MNLKNCTPARDGGEFNVGKESQTRSSAEFAGCQESKQASKIANAPG